MAFSAGSSGHFPEINVTPLIDVLLVLLTIFMVIGPTLPHGFRSPIPVDAPQMAIESQPPVMVSLWREAADGTVHYRLGQKEVGLIELRSRLSELFAARSDRTMYLEADRSLSYKDVALVAGEGRAAGAEAVALTRKDR
jgi:biopolymer transport protein ExbD